MRIDRVKLAEDNMFPKGNIIWQLELTEEDKKVKKLRQVPIRNKGNEYPYASKRQNARKYGNNH